MNEAEFDLWVCVFCIASVAVILNVWSAVSAWRNNRRIRRILSEK